MRRRLGVLWATALLATSGTVSGLLAQPNQASMVVSPDNSFHLDPTPRLEHTGGHTVSFTVTNIGSGPNEARVQFTCAVVGAVASTTCPATTFIEALGGSITVNVTVTLGYASGSGYVQITATPIAPGPTGPAGFGRLDFDVRNAVATWTPAALATTIARGGSATHNLSVQNSGTLNTTFGLQFLCSSQTGCTIAPTSSGALAANATTNATVSYTATAGGVSSVYANALHGPETVGSATITVTALDAAWSPLTASQSVAASSVPTFSGFTLTNLAGIPAATYDLSFSACTGAINCRFSNGLATMSQALAATQGLVIPITYNAPASGGGTVTVRVGYGGVILSTATLSVSTSGPSATVTAAAPQPKFVGPGLGGQTQSFTIQNTGAATAFTLQTNCPTPTATGCTVAPTSTGTLATNGTATAVVTFTGGTTKGLQSALTLQAMVGAATAGSGSATVVVPNAAVTAPAGVSQPTSSSGSSVFTVVNNGTHPTPYYFTAACGQTVVNCSVQSATSTTLPVNNTPAHQVTVGYATASNAGVGALTLEARMTSLTGPILHSATQSINAVSTPGGMVVTTADLTTDSVLHRGQCLALGLGGGAGSECGDLRIVHPLPTVRTMNTWRTPTLIYNSAHAHLFTPVPANLTLPSNGVVPSTVTAVLKIAGVSRGSGSWAGSAWTPGATRRVVVVADVAAAGLATGIHDYTVEITNTFVSGSPLVSVAAGKLVVVDRRTSTFGNGWWLAGFEQLDPVTMLWVGGDGSVRRYQLKSGVTPNRIWGAPSVTYPDTLREVGTEFVRQLPDSVWVYFNAQGRQVRTRNRLGHVTTFAYDAQNRLRTITVPPSSSPLVYTFNYDASNHLSSVASPGVTGTRNVTVSATASNGRVNTITDPGSPTRVIGFGYVTDHRIKTRTNANLFVTTFGFDATNKVSQSSLPSPAISRSIANWQLAGLTTPVDPTAVRVVLTGPRPGVLTAFVVNKYQAPTSIIDGLNQATVLTRANGAYPGLVTQLGTVTGQTILASYDTKGRLQTSATTLPAGSATTTYVWDPKWDQLTRVTDPIGNFVEFGIDQGNGNRMWQQDGRGVVARTTFTYTPDNLIWSVGTPLTNPQDVDYDGLRNLSFASTSQDIFTRWTNDPVGRPITILTATGTGGVGWPPNETTTIGYNPRNQELNRTRSLSGESQTTVNSYDPEGNPLSVTRTWAPNPQNIAAQLTTWLYDGANRPYRQTETDGTFEVRGFDEAGNVTQLTTRRGHTIAMGYDNLNRLTTRNLPAVSFGAPTYPALSQITPIYQATQPPYTWSRPAEAQAFTYTPDGQVQTATGLDADVSRGYHASGLLLSESLSIKTLARTGSPHVYTVTYGYDLAGRRTTLTLGPSGLFAGTPMAYTYHPVWGGLATIRDIAGHTYSFGYNDASVLQAIGYPSGITQTLGHDADWRLTSDHINWPGPTTFPYFGTSTVRNFGVSVRNARGQILTSNDAANSVAGYPTATYSGLGHLQTSYLYQKALPTTIGYLATFESSDSYTYDGLGNILASTEGWGFSNSGGAATANVRQVANTYQAATNRLISRRVSQGTSITTTSYTHQAGDVIFESSNVGGTDPINRERASYFGPSGQLVAVDARVAGQRSLEEFRYDPLGRRVWSRFVPTGCGGTAPATISCTAPYVRRVVWDGSQELAEISAPADTTNVATEELDTNFPLQPFFALGGLIWGDPNTQYGRVVYSPGLAIDQPMSVTRYEYRDRPNSSEAPLTWPTFTMMIFWDYRGAPAFGLYTDGAWARPHTVGTGCPLVGPTRCVLQQWPFAQSAYDRNRGAIQFPMWHGSILRNKLNGTGHEYKRNRVYDPQAGRFTQEDPIGLAGGLNTYGFAGGDPVNSNDPFGLKITFSGPRANDLRWAFERAIQLADLAAEAGDREAKNDAEALREMRNATGYTVDVDTWARGSATDPIAGNWIRIHDRHVGASLVVSLSHELGHAYGKPGRPSFVRAVMGHASDATAINFENAIRLGYALLKPGRLFCQRPYDNVDDLMQRPLEPPCDGGRVINGMWWRR